MKPATLALAILTVGVGGVSTVLSMRESYLANRIPDGFPQETWDAFLKNEPRLARAAVWIQQEGFRRDFRDSYLRIVSPDLGQFEGHASAGKVLENRMTGEKVIDLDHQARLFYMQIDLMLRRPEAPPPNEVFASICARRMLELDREIGIKLGTGLETTGEKDALVRLSNLIRELGGRQPELMHSKFQVSNP